MNWVGHHQGKVSLIIHWCKNGFAIKFFNSLLNIVKKKRFIEPGVND